MKLSKRELFDLCQRAQSLSVMDVDSLACDNAAATIGSGFNRGEFTDEFVEVWFCSIVDILSSCEFVTETARRFFSSHGVDQ